MTLVRVGIFLFEATRESRRVRTSAEILGLAVLDSATLRALRAIKPGATTVFILGTGSSVADLSDQKLKYIQTQFSIGINQWILHPLVPDVYSYEVHPDRRLLQALDREEVRKKAPYLLFLKPVKPEEFSIAYTLPRFMKNRSFLYGRVNIFTRRDSNIARDFRDAIELISRLNKPEVLLDNGASVARMIALSVLLGFEKIVLVGVDLSDVKYFWDRNPNLVAPPEFGEILSIQKGMVHETLSATNRPFGIDTYVARLDGDANRVNILIESPSSKLASQLEVWSL